MIPNCTYCKFENNSTCEMRYVTLVDIVGSYLVCNKFEPKSGVEYYIPNKEGDVEGGAGRSGTRNDAGNRRNT